MELLVRPPSIILNIVKDDYQMILHALLHPNMWISTGGKGKPRAALESSGSLGSSIHKGWVRQAASETKRSSSSPRGPLCSSPFSQYFLWFIRGAKELSVRADNKIQPRRKIYIPNFSPIRVGSTGKREPHLRDTLSFSLAIIKTIVAMAIRRVLQIYERKMSWLFGGYRYRLQPQLGFIYGRAEMWLEQTAEQRWERWENLKLNYVAKILFSAVPRPPACLLQ